MDDVIRARQLPPRNAGTYTTNVSAGATNTAFTILRGPYCGVVLHGKANQDLLLHVDGGTEFSGTVEWLPTRTFFAQANIAFHFPCETPADHIRVRVQNPGVSATTEFKLAAYLSTLTGMPVMQHPSVTLWTNQTLTAGSGDVESPILDLSNSLGANIVVKVTNGATGPTVAPEVYLLGSADGVTFGRYAAFGLIGRDGKLSTFPTTNSAVTTQCIMVPHTFKYARLSGGKNTGQNVTVSAVANLAHY